MAWFRCLSLLAILVSLLISPEVCGQEDFSWWNETHDWDGITPWYDYIITSPAYMGPNALPVPTIKDGRIAANAFFNLNAEKHLSAGDETENLHAEFFTPLYSKRVGLNIEVVPIERYRMDTITRDRRRARTRSGEGVAAGDIYVGTYIQLLEDHDRFPDLLLTINLKTASGSKLRDARFTDAPGYFFDLSFGKHMKLTPRVAVRPHGMVGFYAWQLHGNAQRQNDAFLYGAGIDVLLENLEVTNAIGGYNGYLNNGDRPMVYRLSARTKRDSGPDLQVLLQRGLHDFDYTSFRLGVILNFGSSIEPKHNAFER